MMVTEPLLHSDELVLKRQVSRSTVSCPHPSGVGVHQVCGTRDTRGCSDRASDFRGDSGVLEGPADREPVERLVQLCMNPPIVLKASMFLPSPGCLLRHGSLSAGLGRHTYGGADGGAYGLLYLGRLIPIAGPPVAPMLPWCRAYPVSANHGAMSADARKNLVSRCRRTICGTLPYTPQEAAVQQRIASAVLSLTIPYAKVTSSFFLSW